MKYCPKCKETKPINNFSKNKNTKDGMYQYCKKCTYQYQKDKGYDKKYREKYPERYKKYRKKCYNKLMTPERRFNYKLKNLYNLTIEQFDKMYKEQNGKCKICKIKIIKGRNLFIDHCHKSGKVRGLLCSNCNTGLGQFKDKINLLKEAIKYLKNESN